jgi:hypothetical protein
MAQIQHPEPTARVPRRNAPPAMLFQRDLRPRSHRPRHFGSDSCVRVRVHRTSVLADLERGRCFQFRVRGVARGAVCYRAWESDGVPQFSQKLGSRVLLDDNAVGAVLWCGVYIADCVGGSL